MTAPRKITTGTTTKPQAPAKAPMPKPTVGEYQGKPTITLAWSADSKYPFTFGQSKAKLIVANIESIKRFAETGKL